MKNQNQPGGTAGITPQEQLLLTRVKQTRYQPDQAAAVLHALPITDLGDISRSFDHLLLDYMAHTPCIQGPALEGMYNLYALNIHLRDVYDTR